MSQPAVNLAIFAVFAGMLGLFPFLAAYLVELGADAALAGGVLAAYSAANVVGNAAGGLVADRWGRAWPIRVGLAGVVASFLLYGVPRLEAVSAAHAAHGLMAGLVAPAAFAWVGDRSRREGRGRTMGRTGAAIAVAAVVAPAAGGILAQRVGPWLVFLLLALLTLAALLSTLRLTAGRQALPVEPAQHPGAADALAGQPARRGGAAPVAASAFASPPLLMAYAAALAVQMGFGLLIWLLPLQAETAGMGSGPSGALMGLLGAIAGLWMGLGGSVADRLARPAVIGLGMAGLAVGQALLAGALDARTFWLRGVAGVALFGTGFGTVFPAAAALVVDATRPSERGRAFSLFSIAFSVGAMVAPAIGGVLVRAGWVVVPGGQALPPAGWWETPYAIGILAAALTAAAAGWSSLVRGFALIISRRSGT